MAARYVLSQSGSQFHFVLKAGNNEVILQGERYTARQKALAGIASVRANALYEDRYLRKNAANGQPMFNLMAANGQVIGTSETYTSTGAREIGIRSVMSNGPDAPIDDQT
ncbi:YegP family protein [uncultured Stenotrophomonas sp.]|uniref:YegP family protein n=1 Tax=uncultured Stenotrophomonas sp. TaxID=165438 RepID=UPI0028E627CB|nr:YegP family protein [uncultured Stenotrophomonas sp.]